MSRGVLKKLFTDTHWSLKWKNNYAKKNMNKRNNAVLYLDIQSIFFLSNLFSRSVTFMRLSGFNDIISVNSILFFIELGGPVTFGSQGDGASQGQWHLMGYRRISMNPHGGLVAGCGGRVSHKQICVCISFIKNILSLYCNALLVFVCLFVSAVFFKLGYTALWCGTGFRCAVKWIS